jgi:hypothetical protein
MITKLIYRVYLVGSLTRRRRPEEDDNLMEADERFDDPDKTLDIDITGTVLDVDGLDWKAQDSRFICTGKKEEVLGYSVTGGSVYVNLKIVSNEIAKPHVVDLPYYSVNQLDLLVLGNILIGETVHYHKERFMRCRNYWDDGLDDSPLEETAETYWSLEMLTGKMAGHVYKMRKDS